MFFSSFLPGLLLSAGVHAYPAIPSNTTPVSHTQNSTSHHEALFTSKSFEPGVNWNTGTIRNGTADYKTNATVGNTANLSNVTQHSNVTASIGAALPSNNATLRVNTTVLNNGTLHSLLRRLNIDGLIQHNSTHLLTHKAHYANVTSSPSTIIPTNDTIKANSSVVTTNTTSTTAVVARGYAPKGPLRCIDNITPTPSASTDHASFATVDAVSVPKCIDDAAPELWMYAEPGPVIPSVIPLVGDVTVSMSHTCFTSTTKPHKRNMPTTCTTTSLYQVGPEESAGRYVISQSPGGIYKTYHMPVPCDWMTFTHHNKSAPFSLFTTHPTLSSSAAAATHNITATIVTTALVNHNNTQKASTPATTTTSTLSHTSHAIIPRSSLSSDDASPNQNSASPTSSSSSSSTTMTPTPPSPTAQATLESRDDVQRDFIMYMSYQPVFLTIPYAETEIIWLTLFPGFDPKDAKPTG